MFSSLTIFLACSFYLPPFFVHLPNPCSIFSTLGTLDLCIPISFFSITLLFSFSLHSLSLFEAPLLFSFSLLSLRSFDLFQSLHRGCTYSITRLKYLANHIQGTLSMHPLLPGGNMEEWKYQPRTFLVMPSPCKTPRGFPSLPFYTTMYKSDGATAQKAHHRTLHLSLTTTHLTTTR